MTKSEAARLNGKKGGRPKKTRTVLGGVAESVASDVQSQKPVEPIENPFGLTPRELLFVEAYCGAANFNARVAYEMAGFGGTKASQQANGARLARKDHIRQSIENKLAKKAATMRGPVMDGDEALERLSAMARVDIGKVLGEDDPIAKLPEEVRMCIKAIRPTRYGRVIELHDAMKATELMARVAGKLKEAVQIQSLEVIIAQSFAQEAPAA